MANLQLLEGPLNEAKNDTLPVKWLLTTYPDQVQRQAVLDRYDIGAAPETALDFIEFYKARRERMRERLTLLLGAEETAAATPTLTIPTMS